MTHYVTFWFQISGFKVLVLGFCLNWNQKFKTNFLNAHNSTAVDATLNKDAKWNI